MTILLCNNSVSIGQNNLFYWDSLQNYTSHSIYYDILEGFFLYENLIDVYIEGDAIVKSGNFIWDSVINVKLYQNGLFTYFRSEFAYSSMRNKNPNIHFDTISVFKVFGKMRYDAIQNGSLWGKTDINPFCGAYFKRYRMKIEVLNLGKMIQRIPLIMDCNELEKYRIKHNGKNYEISTIPTYLITRVFEFKEI